MGSNKDKAKVRGLLESLSTGQIDVLLGIPLLLEEVLEQAEHSPVIAEKLMQLADDEAANLTPEERERGREIVRRALEADQA